MKSNDKPDVFAVLRVKDFQLFLSFRFFMTIAAQMQSIIVSWQVYELTKDPLALGLIGLAEAIPFIAVALYAGHVADMFDRKKIIFWFDLLFLAGSGGLLLFTFYHHQVLLSVGIFPVYAMVAISGISRAFLYPSTIALMSQMVPRELYANSSTWNSALWHIAAITGPAIGGLVYGFFGVKVAYMTVILFMSISLLLLGNVRNYPVPKVE